MKIRRTTRILVEPPASATGDIAFNLIVFFLVCASVQPDSGHHQVLPNSETVPEQEQTENIEVKLRRQVVFLNGLPVPQPQFVERLATKLAPAKTDADRIVVLNTDDDVPYWLWIDVTTKIEEAGGTVTLQLEEEQTVNVP